MVTLGVFVAVAVGCGELVAVAVGVGLGGLGVAVGGTYGVLVAVGGTYGVGVLVGVAVGGLGVAVGVTGLPIQLLSCKCGSELLVVVKVTETFVLESTRPCEMAWNAPCWLFPWSDMGYGTPPTVTVTVPGITP